MHKAWFHTDGQAEKIVEVQKRYGDRVRVETFGQEHMFSIESRDPALEVGDIVSTLGLVDYDSYVARCTAAQQLGRSRAASSAGEPVEVAK